MQNELQRLLLLSDDAAGCFHDNLRLRVSAFEARVKLESLRTYVRFLKEKQ